MANNVDPRLGAFRAQAPAEAGYDAGLRSYMLSIYNYMASGVLLTGIVALLVPAEGMEEKAKAAVERVNRKLSSIERIRHTAVVPPFSVENGMLTPTMKVKRRVVLELHAAVTEGLFKR